jgi:hypothetical protein
MPKAIAQPTTAGMMWEFLGVVFGVFVSIVASVGTVVWVEFLRRPSLYLERAEPNEAEYQPPVPATHVRSLRVRLHNGKLPRWADWWTVHEPALQCRARIRAYSGHCSLTRVRLVSSTLSSVAWPYSAASKPAPSGQ